MIFPNYGVTYQATSLEGEINFFEQMHLFYLLETKAQIHKIRVAGKSRLKMTILDDRFYMAEYYLHILEGLLKKYKGVH